MYYTVFYDTSSPLFGPLDDKGAPFNGVDEDKSTLEEGVVTPSADEIQDTTLWKSIILGVNVKEANLLHSGTGRVPGQA